MTSLTIIDNRTSIFESIQEITGTRGGDQIVFYGFEACKYLSYQVYLKACGCEDVASFESQRVSVLADRFFIKHTYPEAKTNHRMFKMGLVNTVVENFFRSRRALPLLPLVFCIDTEDKPSTYSLDPRSYETTVTFKEIKRAYKLCFDPSVPEEVRKVAQRTFFFAKTKIVYLDTEERVFYPPVLIQAPWQHPSWNETAFMHRRISKKENKSTYWRDLVKQSIHGVHLVEAVQKGDKALIRSLLEEHEHTLPVAFLISALVSAIKRNDLEAIAELLDKGSLEHVSPYYAKAFMAVEASAEPEVLKALRSHPKFQIFKAKALSEVEVTKKEEPQKDLIV